MVPPAKTVVDREQRQNLAPEMSKTGGNQTSAFIVMTSPCVKRDIWTRREAFHAELRDPMTHQKDSRGSHNNFKSNGWYRRIYVSAKGATGGICSAALNERWKKKRRKDGGRAVNCGQLKLQSKAHLWITGPRGWKKKSSFCYCFPCSSTHNDIFQIKARSPPSLQWLQFHRTKPNEPQKRELLFKRMR